MKIYLSIFFIYIGTCIYAQQTLQLLFVGDVMGHDTQIQSAYNDSLHIYNYDDCFQYISPLFNAHDFTIANLEVTLGCKPYSGYPAFSSPPELAVALYNSGVNCFVTANNHSADRGRRGVLQTIKSLDSIGIKHTGTFVNTKEREKKYPLIISKHGITVAILNYTYGLNGIPVPEGTVINIIDTIQIASDIKKAKKAGVDKTIVCIHWGTEYELSPNENQIQIAEAIFRAGAEIIIGSHPHVVQRAEFYKTEQRFVVYSLGNFISNQRTQPRDGGMMIHIELKKTNNKTIISDAKYIRTWVYCPTENGKLKFYVLPVQSYINKPDFFDTEHAYDTMKETMEQINPILQQNIDVRELNYEK